MFSQMLYLQKLIRKFFFFSFSVIYIKEELDDTAVEVKIERDVDTFLDRVDGFNEDLNVKNVNQMNCHNDSTEKIFIKTDPQRDDLVSNVFELF